MLRITKYKKNHLQNRASLIAGTNKLVNHPIMYLNKENIELDC